MPVGKIKTDFMKCCIKKVGVSKYASTSFWGHGFFALLKELHGLTRFLVCVYIKFIRDELLRTLSEKIRVIRA